MMRIAMGSDHRGFSVKTRLLTRVRDLGHDVSDEGTPDCQSADYPDIAAIVADKVSHGIADRGILICGTGIGMAITANKFRGVRAATCHDDSTAQMCRRHNDVNVLCLSGEPSVEPDHEGRLDRIVEIWLRTEFEGGRHARRVEKIAEIERRVANGTAARGDVHSQAGATTKNGTAFQGPE